MVFPGPVHPPVGTSQVLSPFRAYPSSEAAAFQERTYEAPGVRAGRPSSAAASVSDGATRSQLPRPQGVKKPGRLRLGKRAKPLQVIAVPQLSGERHPPVPHPEVLPQHEFTLGLIAPKGSGKTTLIANLLEFYAGYFHTIVVFSPTIENDDKWDVIREMPLRSENAALKRFIEKRRENKDGAIVGNPTGMGRHRETTFDPRIPEDCLLSEYCETTLGQLLDEQDAQISSLKKMGAGKFLANRMLLVFDDLVGSKLFDNRKDNRFKGFITRHRHYSASVIKVTQAYKEIPKTIRTQFSGLILFEIPNKAEVDVVYGEYPVGMDRETWDEAYRFCTGGEFSFMYLQPFRKERSLRVMRNFDQVVFSQ